MSCNQSPPETLTPIQMAVFLEEIAQTASVIEHLSGVLQLGAELPDPINHPAAINGAMGMLSQRIGFLAEEAGRRFGGPYAQLRGRADQWLLPQVAQKGGAQ